MIDVPLQDVSSMSEDTVLVSVDGAVGTVARTAGRTPEFRYLDTPAST
jgi:hypothetical protein